MPPPVAEVPLSLFGGLDTELAPVDLPEGISPGNQDVGYLPGSVFQRPGFHKIYTARANTAVLYEKQFIQSNGLPLNLFLYSDGTLCVEDPIAAPGTLNVLGTTTPGLVARSTTNDGREYIALSDGLHGAAAPIQFDGINLDRVSQDGPGAAPNISNLILPAVSMASGSSPGALFIANIVTSDLTVLPSPQSSYYATITVTLTTPTTSLNPGQAITISGNTQSNFNGTFQISVLLSTTQFKCYFYSPASEAGTGGLLNISSGGVTMSRVNNVVTVTTAQPHQLQTGYQVQITDVPAAQVGGGITSIVIDNEDNPGIATVTTTNPHGLVPETSVTISFVGGVAVGGAITSAVREGGITSITTHNHHGLQSGSLVSIAGVGDASFNVSTVVAEIETAFTFTFTQADVDASSSGGTVTLDWAISSGSAFTVLASPSATTFQIQVNYSDGTWTSGQVSYAWAGTFFVQTAGQSIFTYQQYGPNATTTSVGTVTPYGQAAPGKHQLRVSGITRQGYITPPSPPVNFVANGGQYLQITNLPIGPSNWVARLLQFTGADGAEFFFLDVPAQVNGQQVSTSTQVNDNTTETVVLDFSDSSLFAGVGASIPGNDIAAQIPLGPCLGNFAYASRMFWWGDRTVITNFLNLGFDGGSLPSSPMIPTGWINQVGNSGGTLGPGLGLGGPAAWYVTGTILGTGTAGEINQPAYQDYLGVPILQPNTQYTFSLLAHSSEDTGTITAVFFSPTVGELATATIPCSAVTGAPAYVQADFSAKTPLIIPPDTVLQLYVLGIPSTQTVILDEPQFIYTQNPYNLLARGSYVINFEAFDGVTGNIGPASDPNPVINMLQIRDQLYFQTVSRLYETSDVADAEPVNWVVNSTATDCGILGPFASDVGEDWAIWASQSGLRGFGGGEPAKLSQEIQTLWGNINPALQQFVWVKNDPITRRVYIGIPTDGPWTNLIYVLDYRENDLMAQIIAASPVRISYSGRMVSSDLGRKWTFWNAPIASAGYLYQDGQSLLCFGGNTFGNVYFLDPAKLTDDDFGEIFPYYITYAFVGHDQEQALQVGSQRKLYKTVNMYASGVGFMQVTALADSLTQPRPPKFPQVLQADPPKDLSWGLNVGCERCFFKITPAPITGGTDKFFNLTKLIVRMMKHPVSPGRSAI